MTEGGCFCGKVRVKYTGDAQVKALCHCADCKKITGSTYSTNIIIPGEGFNVTSGKPKERPTTADSGKTITSFFCGDCGTTLYRKGETFGDAVVIKAGVLDTASAMANAKPGVELYVLERPSWVSKVEGATQLKGMPGSEEV